MRDIYGTIPQKAENAAVAGVTEPKFRVLSFSFDFDDPAKGLRTPAGSGWC
jgi:hypothetical protein